MSMCHDPDDLCQSRHLYGQELQWPTSHDYVSLIVVPDLAVVVAPQHLTVPLRSRTQVWWVPIAISTGSVQRCPSHGAYGSNGVSSNSPVTRGHGPASRTSGSPWRLIPLQPESNASIAARCSHARVARVHSVGVQMAITVYLRESNSAASSSGRLLCGSDSHTLETVRVVALRTLSANSMGRPRSSGATESSNAAAPATVGAA
jgi:hypothetical protein